MNREERFFLGENELHLFLFFTFSFHSLESRKEKERKERSCEREGQLKQVGLGE